MDNHPTGELAEMNLMTDLMKLEAGLFKSNADRDSLVQSALRCAAIVEREGTFSRGDAALKEIIAKLEKLSHQ